MVVPLRNADKPTCFPKRRWELERELSPWVTADGSALPNCQPFEKIITIITFEQITLRKNKAMPEARRFVILAKALADARSP